MQNTEKNKKMRLDKRILLVAFASFIVGALWLVALRFVTIRENEVHYHANFALFVNGDRHAFDRFTFYEEVQSCGDGLMNPRARTHMHENVSHIVHVHDDGATWGHFFANLGMTNGDTLFKTDSDTFVEDSQTSVRFILNGEEVETTANRTINDEDVLLVSIDSEGRNTDLLSQYTQIQQDASEYNQKNDPASCAGGKALTTSERIKKSIGIFGE